MGSQLLKFYKLHNLKVLLTDSLFNFRHTHPPAVTYFYICLFYFMNVVPECMGINHTHAYRIPWNWAYR